LTSRNYKRFGTAFIYWTLKFQSSNAVNGGGGGLETFQPIVRGKLILTSQKSNLAAFRGNSAKIWLHESIKDLVQALFIKF
jgi:hypothetical protein